MILAIYGSGNLGREIALLIKEINKNKMIYNELVFVNDFKTVDEVDGIRVTTFDDIITKYKSEEVLFTIGIGEPIKRKEKHDLIKLNGYTLATLVHPSLFLPDDTIIEEGVVINKNSHISLNTKIGKNTYIQPMSAIGHDVVIGENCVISTHSTISGHCHIGNNSYIAINVPIREGISIGNNCIIGMGSVITKDVPNDTITAGPICRQVPRPKNKLVFK